MNNPEVSLEEVSLIIATFNEEQSIAYVLDEIKDYNFKEIIVVDGNSTDNTETIVGKYNTKFISQTKKGWVVQFYKGLNTLVVSM